MLCDSVEKKYKGPRIGGGRDVGLQGRRVELSNIPRAKSSGPPDLRHDGWTQHPSMVSEEPTHLFQRSANAYLIYAHARVESIPRAVRQLTPNRTFGRVPVS